MISTEIICINQASSTSDKMDWKGSIKIPDKREFYVRAKFVIDETNGLCKQTNLMNKIQNDFFNNLKRIQIQSSDLRDIFQRLEITRFYRDLIYVRFEPDVNKNKSWVIIGNKMKTYVNDEAVYEEEFNEYKDKKKTYSVVHIRSEFNSLIENFFIFGLKSKQTDKVDFGLKDNLDLPLIRNRDLLIGVIIPVFEKDKQKIPNSISSPTKESEKVVKKEEPNVSRDPRLNRYLSLNNSQNGLIEQNNPSLNRYSSLNNSQNGLIEQNNPSKNKYSSSNNNQNSLIEQKQNSNEIKKEKLDVFSIKSENIFINGVDEELNDDDKYSMVSSSGESESCNSISVSKSKSIKIKTENNNDNIVWSGYFITDINSKIKCNLFMLNENSNFKEHLYPFLKEEIKIYIDKLSSCKETNYDIFDYLTGLDKKSIQFLKFESNDREYFVYIDELLKRDRNIVKLRNTKNFSFYIFALKNSNINDFNKLASDGFNLKPVKEGEKCLIGAIVYLQNNYKRKYDQEDVNESGINESGINVKHLKSSSSIANGYKQNSIYRINSNSSTKRSVSLTTLYKNDSVDVDDDDQSFIRTLPIKKQLYFRNFFSNNTVDTKNLIFTGIKTTNYTDEVKFVNDVLEALRFYNVKLECVQRLDDKYGQIKVTLRDHILGARILSRKKWCLKDHDKFDQVFIDPERIHK